MTRWIAGAGAFLVSLDSTVNIAFPAMAATFRVFPEHMRWVIVGYVLAYSIMSFVGGVLADRFGYGRVFGAGLVIGVMGFVVCGSAPRFAVLLGGRVVQGLGAGLVYGTAPGLVTLTAPPSARGRALGFLNAAIGLAFTIGPLVAGALVASFGWRSLFYLRVPLALVVFVWAVAVLPLISDGAGTLAVSVDSVVRARVTRMSVLAFLAFAGIFAIWLLGPFYLLDVRRLDSRAGGALFMLTPLATTIAAPLAGWLTDRTGARSPILTGLVIEALGLALMSRARADTSLIVIALALFAAGLGLGVFQVPNMAAIMAAFPAGQQGAAGGLAFLARTLGVVAGVATLGQIVSMRRSAIGFETAFGESLVVATVAVAAAALLAAIPAKPPISQEFVKREKCS